MKVYVIQVGEYSDKYIAMATTDKEYANKTAVEMEKGGKSVMVYELEDGKEANYLPLWVVEDCGGWSADLADAWGKEDEDYGYTYFVKASSPEVAIKIAQDRKAKRKAEFLESML